MGAKKVSCPFCKVEFINQGALNLHLARKKECKALHQVEKGKTCSHEDTRALTAAERQLTNEQGQSIAALGLSEICLNCGELI